MQFIEFIKKTSIISRTAITVYDAYGMKIVQYGGQIAMNNVESQIHGFYKAMHNARKYRNPLIETFPENQYIAMVSDDVGRSCVIGPTRVGLTSQAAENENCLYTASETLEYEFFQLVLLIYEFMTEDSKTVESMMEENSSAWNRHESARQYVDAVVFERMENTWYHTPYQQERREQDSIKNGDIEAFEKAISEVTNGQLGRLAKDELRHIKNIGIVVIALASRSAIEGGLNSEVAYSLHDSYINQLEELKDVQEITWLVRDAERDFIRQVAALKTKQELPPLIDQCLNSIFVKLHGKISVTELAQELHTSPNYLSRLFREKMGITIMDYCKQEKIRLAKNLLRYSEYSIEEISYYLGFASQSHFGKTFKEVSGVTPKQYKMTHAEKNFSNS